MQDLNSFIRRHKHSQEDDLQEERESEHQSIVTAIHVPVRQIQGRNAPDSCEGSASYVP